MTHTLVLLAALSTTSRAVELIHDSTPLLLSRAWLRLLLVVVVSSDVFDEIHLDICCQISLMSTLFYTQIASKTTSVAMSSEACGA